MIIRILGEGQYDVPDNRIDDLNTLDERLQTATESGDQEAFACSLGHLLAAVHGWGTPLPDAALTASELVLPSPDAELHTVRALLSDEGSIAG
jgi:hypothetical protein